MKRIAKVVQIFLMISLLGGVLVACGQEDKNIGKEVADTEKTSDTKDETSSSEGSVVWPEGNVTFSIPGKAGGGSDLTSRYISTSVEGVKFSLMNFSSTEQAFQNVATKKPDGKNIALAHSAIMTNYVTGSSDLNPLEDFTLLAAVGNNGLNAIAVPIDAPYDTLEEFATYAKEHPGEIKAGTSPSGTSKFTMGKIERELGIQVSYVECSQQADRLTNLSGGFIDIGTISLKNGLEYEKAGKLKVLATIGANGQKVENFETDAPENFKTCQEQGYEDLFFVTSYYVIGPANMDEGLVKAINEKLEGIVAEDSDYVSGMKEMGQVPEWHNVEESIELYTSDFESMQEVAEALGMLDI